jgi:hypothetical protein
MALAAIKALISRANLRPSLRVSCETIPIINLTQACRTRVVILVEIRFLWQERRLPHAEEAFLARLPDR